MRRHSPVLSLAALALGATLALAEPSLVVRYPGGVPQVSITGDYAGARYTVLRAPAAGGEFVPITESSILCLGSCYAEDRGAVAGESYLYRFDLVVPSGDASVLVSYGPYRATISPALGRALGAFAFPNPGRGATQVQLYVGGAEPVAGDAAVFDLAGRRVSTIARGVFPQGLTTLAWDGRDERGVSLAAGVYLLRFAAADRVATFRLLRR